MKNIMFSALVVLIFANAFSQTEKKDKDREAIKNMCGCYEVTFNFAETFNYGRTGTFCNRL